MKISYKKLWIELIKREISKATLKKGAWAGGRYDEQAFKE